MSLSESRIEPNNDSQIELINREAEGKLEMEKKLNSEMLVKKAFKTHKQIFKNFNAEYHSSDSGNDQDPDDAAGELSYSDDEDTRKLRRDVVRQREIIHR